MSNRWVISWLVIGYCSYCRWSISNRSPKFCGLSITHRWHRSLIDVIDYSSTIILRTEDSFLLSCTDFFSFVILLSVLDTFFLITEVPVDDVETQSANHKYRCFSVVQYFTLPNSLFLEQNNWTVTNQYENDRRKYENEIFAFQKMALEALYKDSKCPSQGVIEEFAKLNKLDGATIKVWFNNKR